MSGWLPAQEGAAGTETGTEALTSETENNMQAQAGRQAGTQAAVLRHPQASGRQG